MRCAWHRNQSALILLLCVKIIQTQDWNVVLLTPRVTKCIAKPEAIGHTTKPAFVQWCLPPPVLCPVLRLVTSVIRVLARTLSAARIQPANLLRERHTLPVRKTYHVLPLHQI